MAAGELVCQRNLQRYMLTLTARLFFYLSRVCPGWATRFIPEVVSDPLSAPAETGAAGGTGGGGGAGGGGGHNLMTISDLSAHFVTWAWQTLTSDLCGCASCHTNQTL